LCSALTQVLTLHPAAHDHRDVPILVHALIDVIDLDTPRTGIRADKPPVARGRAGFSVIALAPAHCITVRTKRIAIDVSMYRYNVDVMTLYVDIKLIDILSVLKRKRKRKRTDYRQ